jgi:transcriptional regulator with XRE-family HTH domain
MSIGETLAAARRGSGLSVTEVSRRTRIRETLVTNIERDDYSGCGGDFYTRGHIRAIARVVGTDPEPLIEQYDTARRPAPEPAPAYAAQQSTSARKHGWHLRRHPSGEQAVESSPRVTPTSPPVTPAAAPPPVTPAEASPPVTPAAAPLPATPAEASPPVTPAAAPPPVTPAVMPGTWARGGPPGGPVATASGQLKLAEMTVPQPRREPLGQAYTEPLQRGLPADLVGAQPRREPPAAYAPPRLTPIRRGRRNWPLLLGVALVVVVGVLGYSFVAASIRNLMTAPAAGSHATSGQNGTALADGTGAPSGSTVVVSLTAVRASSVEFTTPAGKYLFRANLAAGASKRWTFRHPVTMTVGNPAGVRLVVNGKNPLPHGAARPVALRLSPGRPAVLATSPITPAPATTPGPLVPARAVAFGVSGPGHGDNPQRARRAIDHSPGTSWATDWYASARFGNLYPGTGLLLDMGRPVTITGAQIRLGGAPGASFQLRVGSAPALADLRPVARAAGASGVVRLRLTTPARGRYVLIWFTKLPLDSHGHFHATVYNVSVDGRA